MSKLKAKLPPRAIMTRAQKAAAEEYADIRINKCLEIMIPQLENIVIMAAVDIGLKQRTVQRLIKHYEMLLTEYRDDLIADPDLAAQNIEKAMRQREIETEEDKQ